MVACRKLRILLFLFIVLRDNQNPAVQVHCKVWVGLISASFHHGSGSGFLTLGVYFYGSLHRIPPHSDPEPQIRDPKPDREPSSCLYQRPLFLKLLSNRPSIPQAVCEQRSGVWFRALAGLIASDQNDHKPCYNGPLQRGFWVFDTAL